MKYTQIAILTMAAGALTAQTLKNDDFRLSVQDSQHLEVQPQGGHPQVFSLDFVVLRQEEDPKMALRPGGLRVSYNLLSWENDDLRNRGAALEQVKRRESQQGDGFDDRVLLGSSKSRTADVFYAGQSETLQPVSHHQEGDRVVWEFAPTDWGTLQAELTLPEQGEPMLTYTWDAREPGYYSIGYLGAPARPVEEADEISQPLIWQEKRFPEVSYLTAAFRTPIPSALVTDEGQTWGVLADASEYPFDPLPVLANSRFGVGVRNQQGEAQPYLFAPLLGGIESWREPGEPYRFSVRLLLRDQDITHTYEYVARTHFGFRDLRHNALGSLNAALDRMVDYGMSEYSHFNLDLKGCSYSTDVPGAVKNVSSLNPLNLALVLDDEEIFDQRAYPIMEYLLSREKFLFSLDPEQKIQNPSRNMTGPSAPVSELVALYEISHRANPVFLELAEQMYGTDRTLNLDVLQKGDSWENSLMLYRATEDSRFLARSRRDADIYIRERVDQPQEHFTGGQFFWTQFTPNWIELFELYQTTGDERYLEAAHAGARRYAFFTFMSPKVPDELVLTNEGGKAPMYWYLASKGARQIELPEEFAPAWRLSAMGLTPESSGTSNGHRAIFMANYAPWMLRIAAETGDAYLHDIARWAVIGRYRNFPGYHINTARTTVYEKADYPLREHDELSVNSFHYNHIWPMMSILLDYLVSDAHARSEGQIAFPSEYIEGYAYLKSKFYGHQPGTFYGRDDAVLWMPRGLVQVDSPEINYVGARGENRFYLALMNESTETVQTLVQLDPQRLGLQSGRDYKIRTWVDNERGDSQKLQDGAVTVTVPPRGIVALSVQGVAPQVGFQQSVLALGQKDAWQDAYRELPTGDARAMIMDWGTAGTSAYVYLRQDDAKVTRATLEVRQDGAWQPLADDAFPYEWTVRLPGAADAFTFRLTVETTDGERVQGEVQTMRR
ncbi:MAG: hypothetical protein E1N59_1326 [Puniceicoccaceae bacterium 5H]|nr:MAG: hypothetical protein E1N59_1326 [Puniceicoccaceae bacterium 5H]